VNRLHREDSGVVAVLVALLLVVLMAAVAITVDVGGLMLRRREMVNGADAGALAAAQSCGDASGTFGDPESMADQYAAKNVPVSDNGISGGIIMGTDPVSGQPWTVGCTPAGSSSSGHVTVRYTSAQSLYFAPVLGFHSTSDVTTQATASWGGAGGGSPVPLVFSNLESTDAYNKCKIPDQSFKGQICYVWYSNHHLTGSSFGYLNFNDWRTADTTQTHNCNNNYDLTPELLGGGVTNLPDLNYPNPTWVCAFSGNTNTDWNQFQDYVRTNCSQGHCVERDFPVSGPTPNGTDPVGTFGDPVNNYDVIGFTHLQLVDVYNGAEATGIDAVPAQSGTCDTKNSSLMNPGLHTWSEFGNSAGCPGNVVPDSVTVQQLGGLVGGSACTTPGTGYVNLNAGGFQLCAALPKNSPVKFTWTKDAVPPQAGQCGLEPPDIQNLGGDIHCIKVRWLGVHFGGRAPGRGANFGNVAEELCDLQYRSCLDDSIRG
jgi:Flp pilus assembly protein TadG